MYWLSPLLAPSAFSYASETTFSKSLHESRCSRGRQYLRSPAAAMMLDNLAGISL